MAAPDQLHVEMPFGDVILDTYDREILDTYGRNILDLDWVDVQADVITETPITIFQGQRGGSPLDRVADSGTIKFVLNNNDSNSGGVMGYYSPDSLNKRGGFEIGARVRVGLTKSAVTEWLSQGRVIDIKPAAGLLENKLVDVTCGDWIETASRTPMPRLPIQQSVTDDQVIQTIVNNMDDAPAATDLEVGAYTYPYALTDVEDEETRVLTVLQSLAQSGLGRIFITGGATSGEVLRYVDLYSLLTIGTPVAAFNDAFLNLEALRRAYKRVKRVVATAYPMAKDASPVVLYSLTNEIALAAGAEAEFVGFYRDPNANSSASIAAVDVVTPVVNTDYKFSSVSGSGTDMNASLEIVAFTAGAKSFKTRVRNNGAVTGYLWFYQTRGKGLYPYDTISHVAVDTTIKENEGATLTYDLPYQAGYTITKEIAEAMLDWYSAEATDVPSFEYLPSASEADFTKFLACKPGTLITVSEGVTNIAYTMILLGREINIWNGGAYISERLFVTPAQMVESALYFTLDTLGQDDLDGDNTILAFG